MKVAIIPARGGSSGLPGKNIKPLCGRPLIAHTIDAALATGELSEVFVSTEDDEIERIAKNEGARVIRHPAELSGPDRPTAPVIAWAVEHLEEAGLDISEVAVMRATTPLRTSADVTRAMDLLARSPNADSVVSVAATTANPARLKRLHPDGHIESPFAGEELRPIRRQELETFYLRNGGLYLAKREVVSEESLWGHHCLALEMPPERSININTDFDFHLAELLMRERWQAELATQPL